MKSVLCLAAALLQQHQHQQQQHREAHEKLDMLERSQLRESRERMEALQRQERHDAASLAALLLEALAAPSDGGGVQSVRGPRPEEFYIGDVCGEPHASWGEGQERLSDQLAKLVELLGASSTTASTSAAALEALVVVRGENESPALDGDSVNKTGKQGESQFGQTLSDYTIQKESLAFPGALDSVNKMGKQGEAQFGQTLSDCTIQKESPSPIALDGDSENKDGKQGE
jgi:hypothetical protein